MKNLFKKITLTLTLLLSINTIPAFAYTNSNENSNLSYNENYLENNLITDENTINQLKQIDPGLNKNSENLISTFAYPNDNPDSRIIRGKVRKAYSNNGIKAVVLGLYNYLATKIPDVAKKNTLYYMLNSFVSINLSNAIKPHYYEAWIWETHDWANGVHRVYTTMVSYTDSSYSKVSSTDYYQVDYYPIYKNGQHYHKY